MSFADIPEETVERFRETFQQSKQLMTYYSCALLEVETKFRVLNQQFSLEQEHNPIETIKTRLKSMESIMDKLYRKKLPFEVSAVEECLTDVAGIRSELRGMGTAPWHLFCDRHLSSIWQKIPRSDLF